MLEALMPTYKRLPVAFERGEGAWLWDDQGRAYLDALSGIAVCGLGHAHPAVTRALQEQAATLLHTSNLYRIPVQEQLGARLTQVAGLDEVFFCNSGAEANEAAIKLARLYGHRRGIERPRILVMDNAFHGRTLGTLAATGNPAAQEGFGPLPEGFLRIPYDDLEAARRAAREHDDIVAVLVEPVQGEGGVRTPAADYLPGLRELCDQQDWLLMLDEVQTGMGRTGRLFAYQHANIRPDVLSLAKGLGNGVPIGACLVGGAARGVFGPGNHGSTFGGNPLAARAALAVLETLEEDRLAERAAVQGRRIREGLMQALGDHSGVREIRGLGLMIGIELTQPCAGLVTEALEQGLLINVTAGSVVRLLPPLVISDEEADRIASGVADLIRAFLTRECA
ncbi:aspartate aminotransferase family protein [Alkalilimnicola ehrlichii MLHE-1]|uniref:Acetylornithine aminotransferase n=1 Tax=Alkalilimnicola ehrlichii (strain ATCC BAA-1101 / DSM 17681 / MLHE-1) TaxID=187272 RepID=Q0A9N3_ALKEH|nr:aspartate aminotransferase family protein [Alkalilimnicola ehrlichii]ABI56454.1 acetylornithine aminotransferase apoenzyme [Alkalilimnicola ehrlichii MLHE-1]